jgi:hypothetical protein
MTTYREFFNTTDDVCALMRLVGMAHSGGRLTQPLDRETALVMFRSTLALHGTPSSAATRVAIMFAARMAAEAGMPATEFRDLATDEYALAKGASIDAAINDAQNKKE